MLGFDIGSLGKTFFSGALIQMAPQILKGAMKEYLWQVKLAEFDVWVREDKRLWDMIDAQQRQTLLDLAPKLGPLDWLTLEWVLETGRRSNPALHSAIVGWEEAQMWIEKQIIDIRDQIRR